MTTHTIHCIHCGKPSDNERWLSSDAVRFICTDCTTAALSNPKISLFFPRDVQTDFVEMEVAA